MKKRCKCEHGFTCGRTYDKSCELPIAECFKQHYVHKCEHVWNGEKVESPDGLMTVTCSVCGMTAFEHDMG